MKNNQEILERYLSAESADIFNAQRLALLCLLPFDMAKPYLAKDYIEDYESGNLPDDEGWEGENFDPKANILLIIPELYRAFGNKSTAIANLAESLLHLRSLLWVVDEPFLNEIDHLFVGDPQDEGKLILDKVAFHFGWTPPIDDVEFEEISDSEESN